ncbi:MAG: hypothetical protein D6750_05010 [Bacteroidetes bacterium]|nr:MAG: hypothetical protein D6750_05010 [Bacteroidota bacterium]
MQGLALFLLLGGAIGALFWPAGTPSLEAGYRLTADRWRQGEGVYTVLQAPIDPLFVTVYRYLPAEAPYLLRLWKALGVIAWGIWLWGLRPREGRSPGAALSGALLLAVHAQVPWHSPLEVGLPLLAFLLGLSHSRIRAFEQGILWGGAVGAFPVASLALLGYLPFYLSRERFRALGLFLLGAGWIALGMAALLRHSETFSAYVQSYWVAVWRLWRGEGDIGMRLLGALALVMLVFRLSAYVYRPYAERLFFQDRVWAALVGWLMPGAGGLITWAVVLAERLPRRGAYFLAYGLGLATCTVGLYTRLTTPTCHLQLPAHSCWWGSAPCYLHLNGPYGCRWTTPYAWTKKRQLEDWKAFYQKWASPQYIFDPDHTWTEVSYHLPHLAKQYVRADTMVAVPVFRRQRR